MAVSAVIATHILGDWLNFIFWSYPFAREENVVICGIFSQKMISSFLVIS